MSNYELSSTVPSPGKHVTFIEFSPGGRFLAVGDLDSSSIYILDSRTGFHQTLSGVTPATPQALVWESPMTFYVGLTTGIFIHYKIDPGPGGKRLVAGFVNNVFHGNLPMTAMALDTESRILVVSVGPGVYAFRRARATGGLHFPTEFEQNADVTKDEFHDVSFMTGRLVPPGGYVCLESFPRSICFATNKKVVVTLPPHHIM